MLAGCLVIAAALYMGLRDIARAQRATPVQLVAMSPPDSASETSPETVNARSRADQRDRATRAHEHAQAALDTHRPTLLATCWQPAVQANPEPARVRYTFDINFDRDGKQVSLGLQEHRGMARADVAQCLRRQSWNLRIPPPGTKVRVQIPLAFP